MKRVISKLLGEYGMLLVLALLCAFWSAATWDEQRPTGDAAARQVMARISDSLPSGSTVLIAASSGDEDRAFAQALEKQLAEHQYHVAATVIGTPADLRQAAEKLAENKGKIDALAVSPAAGSWMVLDQLANFCPPAAQAVRFEPRTYHWPNFLKRDNLFNIANQIVVIAVIAIGMTMVIITAGIDLSVGSLIALSAVVMASVVRDFGGGDQAGMMWLLIGSAVGIAVCAGLGLFNGVMVTAFAIPPFIVTLGTMLVARGLAYLIAGGQSIYQLPESFTWLGRGAGFFSIPHAVVMMVLLYITAHLLMSRTIFGRYVYAVGGNTEAARLSGVPVRRVVLAVYLASGALAGLGGIVMASQLKTGSPTYGVMYELYVIAAVVVGGTSLVGGQGKVLGTLIGAFIIAVIQNGMNLTGVESYTQQVVLGLVILAAVLLDTLKRGRWAAWFSRRASASAAANDTTADTSSGNDDSIEI